MGCALRVGSIVPAADLLAVKTGRPLAADRTVFFEIDPHGDEADQHAKDADAEKSHYSVSEESERACPKQDWREQINFGP
jgi:hypothetical protein